ncbi:phosphoenolpyruvate carboxykinase (ATP) [candidate division CSSED10-310 bacterium]|uniref:Phosphoenolpyruvate carboxykinase (ATP) n=1 Tax=candidate division CSSED10-310 bacterium TaxID=2855610 RepID=A0ABV6Z2Q8_UNCC1
MLSYHYTHQTNLFLESLGIRNLNNVYLAYSSGALYEEIVRRREGMISHLGPIVVRTGSITGRSPNDKFIVREPSCEDKIYWGDVNVPFTEEKFNLLYSRLLAYLQGNDIFIQDCYAGADERYRLPVRVITEYAWHNLFARNMFIGILDQRELEQFRPEFTVIQLPKFHAVPEVDGTNSEAFVIVHFAKKLIIIGGTSYAGEIKKSVFTILNYMLPMQEVMSMHCAANVGKDGDCALFFGLSGTGKTTLSTENDRNLIGDDEHGWSDEGIFNYEGGCYAKVIRISKQSEPEIYQTTRRFSTILENVSIDPVTRRVDLDDDTFTENTRASYPISQLQNVVRSGKASHPENIFLLTADAFGVLPPISQLTPDQLKYYFLSGYTAKVAGTEKGVTEPKATFSACFGAPFMPLHPSHYARILREKVEKHQARCWLVNTGWTKGPYGVGHRMPIEHTRALLSSAMQGKLAEVEYQTEPIFGLRVPVSCEGVPSEILLPRATWDDKEAYDNKAKELAGRFQANFKQYESYVSEGVKKSGPQ